MAGHLEKQFESKRDDFRAIGSSKPELKSKEVPKWSFLRDKVVPPREQVDELKGQLSEAAAKMQAKKAKIEGGVVSIFYSLNRKKKWPLI